MGEWAIGIEELTNDQLAYGVSCVRIDCDWPPSIMEFVEKCLVDKKKHYPDYSEIKLLPVPKAKLETIKKHRDEMKKIGIMR